MIGTGLVKLIQKFITAMTQNSVFCLFVYLTEERNWLFIYEALK